jgi:outer membrane lipoprotein-sorting protein
VRKLIIALLALTFTFAGVARADDQAEVKAILDKAVQALGGADKAAKLSDVTLKGKTTISEGGMDVAFSFDLSMQSYDRIRMDVTIVAGGMTNKAVLVMNGDKAWARDSNRDKVEEAPKEIAPLFQQFLLSLRSAADPSGLRARKELTVAAGGVGTVGEAECALLRVSRKDFADITMYFNAKSGLPLKSETRIKEPEGAEEKSYEFHFSDFKDIDGAKHFGKVKIVRDGKDLAEIELTDFKLGEKFEANTFEKP